MEMHHCQLHNRNKGEKCNVCHFFFQSKIHLVNHKREVHPTFKPCRNFIESNTCKFRNECLFSHSPIQADKHRCFRCGDEFESVATLATHRKQKHNEPCKKFNSNNCKYSSETCWYKHDNTNQITTQ